MGSDADNVGVEEGATVCGICAAGYFSSTGSHQCDVCPAGKYSIIGGASDPSTCIACSADQFSVPGSTTCLPRIACSTMACPAAHVPNRTATAALCIQDVCDESSADLATCCVPRAPCSSYVCPARMTPVSDSVGTLCAGATCTDGDNDVCCMPSSCAEVGPHSGLISSGDSGCEPATVLTAGGSCTVQCNSATHLAQVATVECSATASEGDAVTGLPECVPRAPCSSYVCPAGMTPVSDSVGTLCAGATCADAGAGTTEDDCCETVGQCIGNTDATTDVACTAPKTAIANAGAGTTEDDCCETPAAAPPPADASGSPRTPGGAAVLAAAVGAMTLMA